MNVHVYGLILLDMFDNVRARPFQLANGGARNIQRKLKQKNPIRRRFSLVVWNLRSARQRIYALVFGVVNRKRTTHRRTALLCCAVQCFVMCFVLFVCVCLRTICAAIMCIGDVHQNTYIHTFNLCKQQMCTTRVCIGLYIVCYASETYPRMWME